MKFSTTIGILYLNFIFFSAGCSAIQQDVERGIQKETGDVLESIDDQTRNDKRDFENQIQEQFANNTDPACKQRLMRFKESVLNTSSFLDSLRKELNKLDDMEVKNIELVRDIFISQGIGDSVQNKIKRNTSMAESIAEDVGNKAIIRSLRKNLFQDNPIEWNKHNFGLTGPLGAKIILYGMEEELYKICKAAL